MSESSSSTPKKYKMKFCCNDCERGFTNEAAWRHHGAQTGHNINGDLPSRELRDALEKLAKYEEAYRLLNEERARLAIKLDAIKNVVQL